MPYNRHIYIIDWIKLVTEKTPFRWRDTYMLCWLRSLAAVANDLYNRFMFFRMSIKYSLAITPQVCYLEKALNDRYDVVLRRIIIEDAPEYLPTALYRRAENKHLVLNRRTEGGPLVLYRRDETAQFGVDFIIKIPVAVIYVDVELMEFVKRLRLVTKTYKVQLV